MESQNITLEVIAVELEEMGTTDVTQGPLLSQDISGTSGKPVRANGYDVITWSKVKLESGTQTKTGNSTKRLIVKQEYW